MKVIMKTTGNVNYLANVKSFNFMHSCKVEAALCNHSCCYQLFIVTRVMCPIYRK